jgi:hypothetical protein
MSFESSPSSSRPGSETTGSSRCGCVPDFTATSFPGLSQERSGSGPTCSRVSAPCAPISSIITPVRPEQFEVRVEQELKECVFCRRILPIRVFTRVVVKGNPFRYRYCNQCRHKRTRLLAKARASLAKSEHAAATSSSSCPDVAHLNAVEV